MIIPDAACTVVSEIRFTVDEMPAALAVPLTQNVGKNGSLGCLTRKLALVIVSDEGLK